MRRLKWILPCIQVTLALVLGYWGSVQTLRETKGSTTTYDYLSRPELVLHIINLPAAALMCIITRNGTFQIGLEHSVATFVGYLAGIFALWFLLGWRASIGQSWPATRSLGAVGILFGLFLIGVGVIMLRGPMSLLLILAAFVWGIAIIMIYAPLIRSWKARHVESKNTF